MCNVRHRYVASYIEIGLLLIIVLSQWLASMAGNVLSPQQSSTTSRVRVKYFKSVASYWCACRDGRVTHILRNIYTVVH